MQIYFEKVAWYHYLIIKYYLCKGFDIYVFGFDHKLRNIAWLRKLLDSGKVKRIGHYFKGVDKFAFKNIDVVMRYMKDKFSCIDAARDLYRSIDVEDVYKKSLINAFFEFHAIQSHMDHVSKQIARNESVFFFPDRYMWCLSILRKTGGSFLSLEKVEIPVSAFLLFWLHSMFEKCVWFVLFLSMGLGLFLLGFLKILGNARKDGAFRYCFPISNPVFQFKFSGRRSFDFILDGKSIRKDNSIFLILNPMEKIKEKKLVDEQYNFLDCTFREIMVSPFFSFSRDRRDVPLDILFFTVRCIARNFFESNDVVKANMILAFAYFRWNLVLSVVDFKNYVAFNDEGSNHIARNIVFKKNGIITWFYGHSSSYVCGLSADMDDFEECLCWYWGFMYYDYYILWNKVLIEYQRRHCQKIGCYCDVGALWAESEKVPLNYLESFLVENKALGKDIRNAKKVVSFFDTTFFEAVNSEYSLQDGIKFYQDVKCLLNNHPDIFIVIKEKKSRTLYSLESHFLYSSFYHEYIKILNELAGHLRCYVAGDNGDTNKIMIMSDLVVTYAFSSSTLEAIASGKRAIFYDPAERFKGYYFDRIPEFVAHGYDQLNRIAGKLLNDVSDDEYKKYSDKYFKGTIDTYMDGKAIDRFRRLLIEA